MRHLRINWKGVLGTLAGYGLLAFGVKTSNSAIIAVGAALAGLTPAPAASTTPADSTTTASAPAAGA